MFFYCVHGKGVYFWMKSISLYLYFCIFNCVFLYFCIFNCVLPSREHVGQVEACAGERGLPLDQRRSKIALCILTAHMLGRRKKVYMDPNQF